MTGELTPARHVFQRCYQQPKTRIKSVIERNTGSGIHVLGQSGQGDPHVQRELAVRVRNQNIALATQGN
jgi:hypothetical protein